LGGLNISKQIICEHCNTEIKHKHDLVVAFLFIEIIPYHSECYVQGLKGVKTFFLANHPVNSASGTYSAVVSVLATIFIMVMIPTGIKPFAIVLLIPLFARLFSYYSYERHLPN